MKDSLAVLAIFTFKGTPFEREMRFLKERSSILEDEFLLPCGTVEGRNRCELRPVITVKVDIESTGYVCRGTNIFRRYDDLAEMPPLVVELGRGSSSS